MTVGEPTEARAVVDPRTATLHMIGNAHIDAVWLWPWEEGFAEVKATFQSALDRMDEYPEFVFTCSSAAYYAWVEVNAPSMFEQIRRRVAEGRWRITGGWWVEPDCNIPSGESFVRQALLGQHYFASRFGRIASVGYNPDAFGHAGSLPQLLRKARLTGYTFLRPEPWEKELPGNLFWWESADGSRVLTFHINFGYTVWGDLEEHVRKHLDRFVDGTDALLCFYGVGNHGGGPTKANIETIRALNEVEELPTLRHSWPAAFFEAVDVPEDLPVVRDELQHHAIGCYAAVSGIKRWNRQAEELLGTAERWASIAAREGLQPYPDDLSGAWRNVLFNQYHDILAGTSIEPAYDDARSQLGESMAVADRALTNGVQAISWAVDTRGPAGARPIVVANPLAWRSQRPVEVELGRHAEGGRLVDDRGREVPYQEVRPLATSRGRHRITFTADLPSLGYRTYRLVPTDASFEWHETAAAVGEVDEATPTPLEGETTEELVHGTAPQPGAESPHAPADVRAGDTWVESDRWRLELDPGTGAIARLVDRRRGREAFSGPAAVAVVAEDRSDTWSHGITHFDRGASAFRAERVRLVDHGPLRATLRVEAVREADGSRIVSEYTVHRDHEPIEVRVTVDWHGRYEILKLRFPVVAGGDAVATWETSYGLQERAMDGAERPGQRWVDVSGTAGGVSILNDGKYSSDVLDGVIGFTVLRSPIYAWHDPFVPEPDGVYPFTDQGVQTFRYAILPHDGDWREAGTVRRAAELNADPLTVLETQHPGPMPASAEFARCDAPSVVLAVLKRAEVGDALVLRAHESSGRATPARIELPRWGVAFHAEFGPSELKTFRIEPDGSVRETDLLEGLEAEPA
ncbi:MAG TPA: glycoside hydrolase family 38 C-terminal domain-containing protein [Candidatus Limnocylindria bacterium]|nr:glycoside hydrolase family 38 C-terminal domain-containing protein [Candidatus Limnocylindria bacterium]